MREHISSVALNRQALTSSMFEPDVESLVDTKLIQMEEITALAETDL